MEGIKNYKRKLPKLDTERLNMIPLVGNCQGCHALIDVKVGMASCPKCGYGVHTAKVTSTAS